MPATGLIVTDLTVNYRRLLGNLYSARGGLVGVASCALYFLLIVELSGFWQQKVLCNILRNLDVATKAWVALFAI